MVNVEKKPGYVSMDTMPIRECGRPGSVDEFLITDKVPSSSVGSRLLLPTTNFSTSSSIILSEHHPGEGFRDTIVVYMAASRAPPRRLYVEKAILSCLAAKCSTEG